MKKLLTLILCITCTLTFFSTFSNANSKTIEKYIYAQDWDYTIKWENTTINFNHEINENKNLTLLLQTCKEDYISSGLKTIYPYLSWENIENIKIYESDFDNSEDIALYLKSQNSIIINKNTFFKSDSSAQHLCILHELAHALTISGESIKSGGFNEPIAEFISYKVCESLNIKFEFSYRDVSMIYMMISNAYGKDEIIHDFYDGTLIENLNLITDNYADELASILYFLAHPSERKNLPFSYTDLIMMAQDIAIHANINSNKPIESYSELLLVNNDYFSELIF